MLVEERRRRIVEEVRRRGSISVAALAKMLEVSGMTIRRDLENLAADGLLEKVHGGATLRRGVRPDATASDRNRPEKEAIAAAAADLVEPGMSVGICAGSTTWYFARHVAVVEDLTVVTNSLRAAEEFRRMEPTSTVVLTGGVRTPAGALVGPVADHILSTLHCDITFLSAQGVDAEAGFTVPNLAEAQTARKFIDSATSAVVLADHTKFGRVSLATIAPIEAVHILVTDDGVDPRAAADIRPHVNELRIGPVGG